MEVYALSRKLWYAGMRSPVPFRTGPQYTNSVPGVPTLSTLRIFVDPEHWSEENLVTVAREIARVLGSTEQYDIGITHTSAVYGRHVSAAGNTARIIKYDRTSPRIALLIRDEHGERAFEASYPGLKFEPTDENFWLSISDPSGVNVPSQP